eukprot:Colp12_sorted_trinity150504_noHs@20684
MDEIGWIFRDYVFGAIYLLLCILASVNLGLSLRQLRTSYEARIWNTQTVFLFLICIQTFVRSWYFVLKGVARSVSSISDVLLTVMGSIPAILYFSTFSILVYYWANMYHLVSGGRRRIARYFFLANLLCYSTSIVCLTLYWCFTDDDQALIGSIYGYTIATYALILALVYLLYGWRLYGILSTVAERSGVDKGFVLWNVGVVTAVCMTCFTFRAIFIYIFNDTISERYWFSIVYFFIAEIVPIMLMLTIYSKVPNSNRNDQSLTTPILGIRRPVGIARRPSYVGIGPAVSYGTYS